MAVGTVNYLYKAIVALLTTPIIYIAHFFIDRYLGYENAKKMTDEAAAAS